MYIKFWRWEMDCHIQEQQAGGEARTWQVQERAVSLEREVDWGQAGKGCKCPGPCFRS